MGAKALTFLGLTYEPNVDDMRESPAIEVVRGVLDHGVACEVAVLGSHIEDLPPHLAGCPVWQRGLTELETACMVALVSHRASDRLPERLGLATKYLDFSGIWPD